MGNKKETSWGVVRKKKTGRMLEGRTWDEMPEREKKELSDQVLTKHLSIIS